MNNIKPFHKQFSECCRDGFTKNGRLQKFKNHPELLPAFWHPAAPKFAKNLKENPEVGITPIKCLRFGGQCNSGNKKCQKLRGYK